MARKKRQRAEADAPAVAAPGAGAASASGLPAEASTGIAFLIGLMMFLAPALGVPHEEMLQDTLKSIVVSFFTLGAALAFFWEQRGRAQPLRWHAIVWLPLMLMAYALGSMAWAHTYLGAVEAIRWFIFSLLLWLAANTLSRDRLPTLAWGVHMGTVVASLWAALQFWTDLALFPQGPHPASTFINRNFFAEYAVCTLPFSALLLAQSRQPARVAALAASSALVITAILMTGTRSALISLWLLLLVVFPVMAWRYRDRLAFGGWPRATRVIAGGLLLGTVVGLGLVPAGDPKIIEEGRGTNALERGARRTESISPNDSSLGVRMIMWKATLHVIHERPLSGVGAGAWESEIPLYQAEGSQLETDYYVHNEYLQLLAEYGLVGWAFLLALAAYLLWATGVTWRAQEGPAGEDAPWRATLLASLLAFMIVSNVGFPWRMAATGALFAVCLGGLAASDARLGLARRWAVTRLGWKPAWSAAALALVTGCTVLALYITQQATEAEQKIIRATKIALTITASGAPNDPRWNAAKAEMLESVREGIAITPHYRKVTPMVADELARWGDWKNATWIWESVLTSRPYVVAIIANVSRGYIYLGQPEKAMAWLERAKRIQPEAPAVRSLEVVLLARTGQQDRAFVLARAAIADNIIDYDLVNAAYLLAVRARDFAYAEKAMGMRMERWPDSRVQGYLQLADMHSRFAHEPDRALADFRSALDLVPPQQRESLRVQFPPEYRDKLGTPAPAGAQTSANKG